MTEESESLVEALATRYASARGLLGGLLAFFAKATCKIAPGAPAATIDALAASFALGEADKQRLRDLVSTKAGEAYFFEKLDNLNREAAHRSAFVLGAVVQLFFVDLAGLVGLSFLPLKIALALANLLVAVLAHMSRREQLRELLEGPNALPPKRWLFGLFANKHYNKAVKRNSLAYAEMAWREDTLYRPAYYANAATLFVGSEFIVAPGKLYFPFSLIVGKLSGLFSTFAMVLNLWFGFKASEDGRRAREKEVAAYRDLDV